MDTKKKVEDMSKKDIKLYAVVKFKENDESYNVATVLKSWICKVGNETVCKWPANKRLDLTNLLKRMTEPEITWQNWPCQVYKEFGDYITARSYERRLVELENTSDSVSDDCTETNSKPLGKGYRRKIQKNRGTSDTDSFSSNEEWEKELQNKKTGATEIKEIDNIVCIKTATGIGEIDFDSPHNEADEEAVRFNQNNNETLVNNDSYLVDEEGNLKKENTCTSDCAQILEGLHMKLKLIENKIDRLLLIVDNNGSSNGSIEDTILHISFPLKSVEDVQKMEIEIENPKTLNTVRSMLQLVGGSDCNKLIRRCLQRCFTDDFLKICSYTGAKNNFPLRDLKIILEIKKTAQRSYTSSDFSIDKTIMEYVRYANARLKKLNV